ncbi:hypothetical protein [Streptomyces sp. NRRL B-24572]|uniref:hypothetical protein n=1 Tax=Streptomyces sp. NRRL B-24572 TaxID=1962156 RepID=UPI000A37065F|nr:hypothetical protein [Streptomyces sp. NRRL B-24572]
MNDDEPVFKKSKWGTNRYVYNPNNPIGLALIIVSSIFAIVMILLMENHAGPFAPPPAPTWSPPSSQEPWPFPSSTP